jgi:hypothetical protein
MRPLLSVLTALALFTPCLALAQAAAPIEDKPAVKFEEVERGFFLEAQVGALVLFGPKADENSGISPGLSIQMGLGYDITKSFSLGLFVLGSNIDTPSGFRSTNDKPGDVSAFTIGLLGSYAFWGRPDDNGIDRLFLDAHAGAGVSLMGPKDVYESMDILVRAGIGLEYFTRLRHFSVGVDLDFAYGVTNLGAGVLILPNMKYTF